MDDTQNEKQKESLCFSVLMQKMERFLRVYGVDELIAYLDEYRQDIAVDEFQKYQDIQKVACEVWELPVADLDVKKLGTANKSVRMTIAYLTYQYTKINRPQLSLMMKAHIRTIDAYMSEIRYRMDHESMYPDFCKKIELIKERLDLNE